MVHPVGRGEPVRREPRGQRRVREQPAPRIHQELGRAAEQEADVLRAALRGVVDDPKHLLVVGAADRRSGDLVQVDHLVQADQQPGEAGQPHEARHQLEVIVEGRVVDDRPHAERGPGVDPAGELPAQPAHRVGPQPFVAAVVATPVGAHHRGEVVATG